MSGLGHMEERFVRTALARPCPHCQADVPTRVAFGVRWHLVDGVNEACRRDLAWRPASRKEGVSG